MQVKVTLSAVEIGQLDRMMQSEITGCETRSEFVRLLLWREWKRRKGLGKPLSYEWQTSARHGNRGRKINPNSKRQLAKAAKKLERVKNPATHIHDTERMIICAAENNALPIGVYRIETKI